MYSEDGAVAICMRVKSERPKSLEGFGLGYLHIIDKNKTTRRHHDYRKPDTCLVDWEAYLAGKIPGTGGLFPEIPIGGPAVFHGGSTLFMPEYNADGEIVGVKRRFSNGTQIYATDSRPGLYLSERYPAVGIEKIYSPEGWSDASILASIGFVAGRPSAMGGSRYLRQLLSQHRGAILCLVGENDQKFCGRWPGLEGCLYLVGKLGAARCGLVMPEVGYKDVREVWEQTGKLEAFQQWTWKRARRKLAEHQARCSLGCTAPSGS